MLAAFVEEGFGDAAFTAAFFWIAVYTGLRLATTTLHHVARYLQIRVGFEVRRAESTRLFGTVVGFPLAWHTGHHAGESLSKLNRATGAAESVVGTFLWQVVEGVVKVGIASAAVFALDVLVATNVVLLGGVTVAVMIAFNRRLVERVRANNRFGDDVSRVQTDAFTNVVTIKTMRAEGRITERFADELDRGATLTERFARFLELKWSATGVGYSLVVGSSLALYLWGRKGSGEPFDVAPAYVLLNYLDRIFGAILAFTGYYGGLIEAATAYEGAEELDAERARLAARPAPPFLNSGWRTLALRGLTFRYADAERAGLDGVDLTLTRGKTVALVGASGSGKTTLLKTLAGLLEAESGTAACDEGEPLPVASVGREALLVPQEPEVFSGTVRENLTLGTDLDDAAIYAALAATRADAVVDRLPGGLDGELAQRGLSVSGGEKQRLALARGLLHAAGRSLVLLDEPTSSLDPATETAVYRGLLSNLRNAAVVSSVHRLNLVPLFDEVVLMEAGRVVEAGSADEVLVRGGPLTAMVSAFERSHRGERLSD